jgi:uncharacterized protein
LTAARERFAALSPLVLVALGHTTQRLVGPALGPWSWLPAMLVFWGTIACVVAATAGPAAVRRWLAPPQRGALWSAVAVGVGLLSLPELLGHAGILRTPAVLVAWLAFALVNPFFEECYWRGLLQDATARLGAFASVSYASLAFAISHPLIWGVNAAGLRSWLVVPPLAIVGAVWAVAYRRTGSLRGSIVGHACANLCGLAAPVLMNLHVPRGLAPNG